MAQNVLARTFELRCRNFRFSSLLYFLAAFEILGQPYCCFWSFESSFFIVLAIMIYRLLYVPDYEVSSLIFLEAIFFSFEASAQTFSSSFYVISLS